MHVAVAVLFVSMAQQGMAQSVYNIKIAGTAVTPENCNDLSVIKGVTGKAKYDNDSKTLTLDGATIHATAPHGITKTLLFPTSKQVFGIWIRKSVFMAKVNLP